MTGRVLKYLLILVGMVAFFGLFVIIFVNSTDVMCARADGGYPTCRVTRMFLGRYPVSTKTVLNVTDVQMEEDCDDGCSYRAVLITSDGRGVPVNEVYTDAGPVRKQVEGIAEFLDSDAPDYHLEVPLPWWVVLLLGGLGGIGVLVLAGTFLAESRRG